MCRSPRWLGLAWPASLWLMSSVIARGPRLSVTQVSLGDPLREDPVGAGFLLTLILSHWVTFSELV